ncbi:unnamed protein product [Ostreobium quekettii]|uniref:Uncharacterized protein n=1 Tax=Ostreobium quekettii TaxID=121088 RepID=A0A8S1J4V0_9CHLO|nr:unnamed protein product [Ostreobium quekettii]
MRGWTAEGGDWWGRGRLCGLWVGIVFDCFDCRKGLVWEGGAGCGLGTMEQPARWGLDTGHIVKGMTCCLASLSKGEEKGELCKWGTWHSGFLTVPLGPKYRAPR